VSFRGRLFIAITMGLLSFRASLAQPAPSPNATGHLQLKFTERSPESSLDEVMRRTDTNPAATAVLSEGFRRALPFLIDRSCIALRRWI
jgi:hypothetical protein